ncbi:Hypothetical protein CINCED_3A019441 [Cinara cedri]|uniref:Uncharacterized protein n=1 Tax=Cinara cedri TaxID=506608 RepID=A0A5E4MG81_9HEMI|nr:Hypothetical protein CINCED_3A019441 [Cinara cedri]
MSDTEDSSNRSKSLKPTVRKFVPSTSRVSLPVRFANPENPASERPIALLSTETKQLLGSNENLLYSVDNTLANVDITLELTKDSMAEASLLNQTIRKYRGPYRGQRNNNRIQYIKRRIVQQHLLKSTAIWGYSTWDVRSNS